MEDDGMILSPRSCTREVVSLRAVCGMREPEGIEGPVIFGWRVGRTNEYTPFDIREWMAEILFFSVSLCLYK
jgi:hypothetical protein